MNQYTSRADLIKLIPTGSTVAEIGVFKGEFSDEILTACSPKKLLLVDIWTGKFGSGDKDGKNHVEIPNMADAYLDLCQKHQFSTVVNMIRCDSATFFRRWAKNSIDAVYIDADHSYDAVFFDLAGSLEVLKPSGFLMGHDYHGDVRRAVDDFCAYHNLHVSAIANDGCPSFLIRLP